MGCNVYARGEFGSAASGRDLEGRSCLKIIETSTAPNPRRVRIFLAEKGISVPLDDGTAIAESVAICRYFEELQPLPPLFGTGAIERATVEMWQRRAELGLWFHVAQAFRHLHPKMAQLEVPQVAAWGEANKGKAVEMMEIFDAQLQKNQFVAGANYSIADITAQVASDFLRPAKIPMPVGLDALKRWHMDVSARPSATA